MLWRRGAGLERLVPLKVVGVWVRHEKRYQSHRDVGGGNALRGKASAGKVDPEKQATHS